MCSAVVHLNYRNAQVDAQSVHIEEPQEAEQRQRVARGDPGTEVSPAQSLDGGELATTTVVNAGHLLRRSVTVFHGNQLPAQRRAAGHAHSTSSTPSNILL